MARTNASVLLGSLSKTRTYEKNAARKIEKEYSPAQYAEMPSTCVVPSLNSMETMLPDDVVGIPMMSSIPANGFASIYSTYALPTDEPAPELRDVNAWGTTKNTT